MNRKIITYVSITYLFSWLIWGRQALNHHYDLGWTTSKWNHFTAGLGPLLGAILTTLIFEKWKGTKRYFQERLFSLPSPKWLLVGVGMPIAFFLISYISLGLVSSEWVSLSAVGINSKVPLTNTVGIWFAWCLFYGLGEEGGWRGFLFPEFCKKHKARISTLYTAAIWAPWHLPLFFYDKDFSSMMGIGMVGWTLGLIFGSLLLGWLVKQSNWNLWPVIMWHGTFNLLTTSDLINPMIPAVMSAMVVTIVLWITRTYDKNLVKINTRNHPEKSTSNAST